MLYREKERTCMHKECNGQQSQKSRETEILCLTYQNGRINVLSGHCVNSVQP